MTFCLTFNGHKHCFVVPDLIDPLRWRKPGPDPGPLIVSDWLKSEVITPQQARDLSILATMHTLSGQLSAGLQRSFAESMKQAVGTIKLPAEASISL